LKLNLQRVAGVENAAVTGRLNGLTRVAAKWKQSSSQRDTPPVTKGARMMVRGNERVLMANLGGTA